MVKPGSALMWIWPVTVVPRRMVSGGLINPPDTMRLGTTVTGQIHMSAEAGFTIPASALTETRGQPAVWIVNPATHKVALRQVKVERYDQNSVLISAGLKDRELVVTAGVQTLHPDQQVQLLRTAP